MAVANAVARQEGDALAAEGADGERVARRAKRRLDAALLDVGQVGHAVEAAAADDADADGLC